MAKSIQNKIRELSYDYNRMQDELEEMESKAPYNGWKDKDGYMDYLKTEMANIKDKIAALRSLLTD